MALTEIGEVIKDEKPKVYAKLAKAMFLSKGKVDTDLGRRLAEVEASTPEDIARLGYDVKGNERYATGIWERDKDKIRGEDLRNVQERQKFRYSFKDTFAYRYLEKLGVVQEYEKNVRSRSDIEQKIIPVTPEHELIGDEFKVDGKGYPFKKKISDYRISRYKDQFFNIILIPEEVREKALGDEFMVKLWTSAYNDDTHLPYLGKEALAGRTREELDAHYIKKQNEFKALDTISVAAAPQEMKDKILEWIKGEKSSTCYIPKYSYYPISKAWYHNTQLRPWELAKELELEDFYKAMEYMGIGITCMERSGGGGVKGVTQVVRHTNAITRQFVSDIKKGFDPSTVRQMVVEDLNRWMKGKVDQAWEFFVRTDAPTEYPDIQTKKRKKPSVKETANFVVNSESAMVNYIKQNMKLKEE